MAIRLTISQENNKGKMNKKSDLLVWMCASFILSCCILLFTFYKKEIIPFGNNTMLVHDMKWQYDSFLLWFGRVLRGKKDFFYSLSGGLGENTMGLVAYYLASPLNIIFVFVDEKNLPIAISILLVLKTGLAASTMCFYLYSKKQDAFSVPFSLFYSLSSYAVCYQFNIMWMDSFLLFPLVIFGLDKIIKGESGFLYTISLALSVLSNYYIAYMICIFVLIYFVCFFIGSSSWNNGTAIKVGRRFIIHSLLGVLLFAVVLIPGVLSLKNSSESRVLGLGDILDFSFSFNPAVCVKYFFAGAFDSNQGILGNYPLVYSGITSFALLLCFFVSSKVECIQKIRYLIIVAILYFSMCCKGPQYIWHGFNIPRGCYYRFAFELVFVIILIGYEYIDKIREDWRPVLISFSLICLIVVILSFVSGFRISYLVNVIFLVMVCSCYYYYSFYSCRDWKYVFVIAAMVICSFELAYNSIKIHNVQFVDTYAMNNEYEKNIEDYNQFKSYLDSNNTEYRTQIIECLGDSTNEGFQFGVNAINTYSSTEDKRAWNIYNMWALGTPQYGSDLEFDQFATEFTTDVLGIKYIISSRSNMNLLGNYELLHKNDSGVLYKNEYALPLAFPVNDTSDDIGQYPEYERLNYLFKALGQYKTNENIYTVMGVDSGIVDELPEWRKNKNSRLYKVDDQTYSDGNNLIIEDIETLRDKIKECQKDVVFVEHNNSEIRAGVNYKTECYTCFSILNDKGWTAQVDGKKVDVKEGFGGFLLVPCEPGEHIITLHYNVPGMKIGTIVSILDCLIIVFLHGGKRWLHI